jgi:heme-degrading monooxygenase HmoA
MVRFINCFEVPAGREEEFLTFWRQVNTLMVGRAGYRAHRLHRSLRPDARFRFVNYVEWDSVDTWQQAHDDEFRRLVSRPEFADFRSTPALYDVIDARGELTEPESSVLAG